MLTRIVQPAPALETFLQALHLHLSRAQAEHLVQLVDGLLVTGQNPGSSEAAARALLKLLA